jgi:hypothetical protein
MFLTPGSVSDITKTVYNEIYAKKNKKIIKLYFHVLNKGTINKLTD